MLKKSSGMKILLSLVMALFYIPNLHAAEIGDVCNNIAGNWQGDWQSRVRTFTCKWQADAQAAKLGKKIILEVTLKNGRPLLFCKRQEVFTLVGTCKNAKVTFDMDLVGNPYLNGKVTNNTISLSGSNVTVNLNKKSA